MIDAHDRPIIDPVWALFAKVIEKGGKRPTLVEWDSNVPDWPVLLAEAERAEHQLEGRIQGMNHAQAR